MINNNYISKIILNMKIDDSTYLIKIPAIKYLIDKQSLDISNKVTFFVGENGTGKSTLIEAIAIAHGFNAEGGTKNFNFSTVKSHSDLHKHLVLSKGGYPKDGYFFRAESFFNVASNIDELSIVSSYGNKSLHEQSHGESFLSLVQNRFGGNGIYILDEPEASLSPMRLLTLLIEIDRLVKDNSQFIIATHSPILMSFPNAQVLEFSKDGIKEVSYEDTEHYQVSKQFLDCPKRMHKYLFND